MSVFDRWGGGNGQANTGGSVFDRWLGRQEEEEAEGGGVMDAVLDTVSTPGRMTAGAIRAGMAGEDISDAILANRPTFLGGTREDDFDDVLAQGGMEDTWGRRALGLGLDLVADPLNLVSGAGLAKVVGKVAGKAGDVIGNTRLGQELAEKFVPHAGLDKFKTQVPLPGTALAPGGGPVSRQELSYADLRRLHQSTKDFVRDQDGMEALEMFQSQVPRGGVMGKLFGPKLQNITSDEAYEIAKALDEGVPLMDPRLDSMRAAAAKRFDEQFQKEVAAGVMPADMRRIDYVTHLLTRDAMKDPVEVRALSGKNPFQTRRDLSFEQGVQAGIFEPDIRRIMATRLSVGDRAIENQKFFAQTAKRFGVRVKKGQQPPPGYVRAQIAAEPALKKALRGVYLPAEIVTDLEKMVELPKQAGLLSKLASGATALWKSYATRANPGFHTRNAVSNMIQSWFGGLGDTGTKIIDPFVVLAKHVDAARKLRNLNTIGDIGRYSGDDIRRALDEYGVIGGSHTSFNELDDVIEGEIKHAGQGAVRRNLNPLDKRNVLLRGGSKAGNAVENTSRLALFLDGLEKGKTLEQAALHVRKYLFDYSELTPFEKKLRDRAIPFYTWLRKNIPLQVENALTQPDKMAVLAKGFDAVEDTTQDRGLGLPTDSIPEWMRDYKQLPFQTDEGDSVFINPTLPIQDLNKLAPDFNKDVMAALNPMVRIPLEVGLNRQFFTEAPIYDERIGPAGDYKKAHDLVQAFDRLAPELSEELGIVRTDRGAEMPAVADYAMRQLPPLSQFGKLAGAVTAEEDENVSGVDIDMLSMAGLPTRVVTPEQETIQQRMKRNDVKATTRAQQKEARRLKKSEVRSLYDRYLSGS